MRYARDRRGYETLYVMHAFDGPRVRVLYACRTVPYAKVGRMTIDDSVQRRLETAYPLLTFDWPKLLKEAAASAPRPERTPEQKQEQRRTRGKKAREGQGRDVREGRDVRQVREARPVRQVPVQEQASAPAAAEPTADQAPEPLEPITELIEWSGPEAVQGQAEAAAEPVAQESETIARESEAVDLVVPPLSVDRGWPAVALIGETRALILRGRFIEIASKILSRIDDPAARGRLFREAGRLNPENWKTTEQAQDGIEQFEAIYGRLAEQLRPQPPV